MRIIDFLLSPEKYKGLRKYFEDVNNLYLLWQDFDLQQSIIDKADSHDKLILYVFMKSLRNFLNPRRYVDINKYEKRYFENKTKFCNDNYILPLIKLERLRFLESEVRSIHSYFEKKIQNCNDDTFIEELKKTRDERIQNLQVNFKTNQTYYIYRARVTCYSTLLNFSAEDWIPEKEFFKNKEIHNGISFLTAIDEVKKLVSSLDCKVGEIIIFDFSENYLLDADMNHMINSGILEDYHLPDNSLVLQFCSNLFTDFNIEKLLNNPKVRYVDVRLNPCVMTLKKDFFKNKKLIYSSLYDDKQDDYYREIDTML